MKEFLLKLWVQVKKILIITAGTSVVAALIALIIRYRISRMILIASLLYLGIGLGALLGGIKINSAKSYIEAKNVDTISGVDEAVGDYKSPKPDRRFMALMGVCGFILMIIGFVLDVFQL